MVEVERIEQKKIASSVDLARELGFERSPGEERSASVRTYERQIGIFLLPKAGHNVEMPRVATLRIDDWGKYGAKHEDILLGVRMGSTVSNWESLVNVTELFGKMDLQGSAENHPSKEALRSGGYEKLFIVLKELFKTKFWEEMSVGMEKELLFGQNLIDQIIIPETKNVFPGFSNVLDMFAVNREIFFVSEPERGKKTRKAIRCWVANYAIEFTYGRVSSKDRNECGIEFHGDTAYTVAPPFERMDEGSVHSGWHFRAYDLEAAKVELSEALNALNLKSEYGVKQN